MMKLPLESQTVANQVQHRSELTKDQSLVTSVPQPLQHLVQNLHLAATVDDVIGKSFWIRPDPHFYVRVVAGRPQVLQVSKLPPFSHRPVKAIAVGRPLLVDLQHVDERLVLLALHAGVRAVDHDLLLGQDGGVHLGLFPAKDEGADDAVDLREDVVLLLLVDDRARAVLSHLVQLFGVVIILFGRRNQISTGRSNCRL